MSESYIDMRKITLKEAIDNDSRPGYIIALLSSYLGARAGELSDIDGPKAEFMFFVGGKLQSLLNDKFDELEQDCGLQY